MWYSYNKNTANQRLARKETTCILLLTETLTTSTAIWHKNYGMEFWLPGVYAPDIWTVHSGAEIDELVRN
jgi:hypothetical protein